jgi:hypothetical protein
MININCSEGCKYEINGKCALSQVTSFSNLSTSNNACAYFIPKPTIKKLLH